MLLVLERSCVHMEGGSTTRCAWIRLGGRHLRRIDREIEREREKYKDKERDRERESGEGLKMQQQGTKLMGKNTNSPPKK